MKKQSQVYFTPYQLKMPLEISKIIEISDPVYTFCEVMDHIDLNKYLAVEGSRTGRKRYDSITLLNKEIEQFLKKRVAEYEKQYGLIDTSED